MPYTLHQLAQGSHDLKSRRRPHRRSHEERAEAGNMDSRSAARRSV